jgi:hypothetical protein
MANEIAAVERNDKAVAFLMVAMPDVQVVTLLAAGKADCNWPNCLKAHLMIAYLKNTYAAATILLEVGAKRDLESCVMCKDKHPKLLFEQLMGVQLKYAGNVQAQVVEGDLVTQAIQALPAMYNSTVAIFIEMEQHAARVVTLLALQKVVSNYYAIAMKGKQGLKHKDIKGGLMAMEELTQTKEKDNLK